MGLLIDGQWHDKWYDTKSTGGKFERQDSIFRNWITKDGSKGPSGEAGFKAEEGRYHLYVSLACPWAHRTLIMRALMGLEDAIGVTAVDPLMLENGWEFKTPEPLYGKTKAYELYTHAKADYSGRVTVPILWDKSRETIVSNESSEIIRMLNHGFRDLSENKTDYYPENLRKEIDEINDLVYHNINNGVYKAGFATKQAVYEEAYDKLFSALDEVEKILKKSAFLVGDEMTEADIRLYTTLVRFDAVYHGHFKCNMRKIEEYSALPNYLRHLYQMEGFGSTTDFDHIKTHYYASHTMINPTQIVPKGPEIDYNRAHNRGALIKAAVMTSAGWV